MNRTIVVLGVALLLWGGDAAAQAVTVQAVKASGGTTYYGIVSESGDSIRVELVTGGTLILPRSQVRTVQPVGGRLSKGDFWAQDLNETRLFFAPTARTLPRSAKYVSVYEFLLPFLGYGVTDRFTLAGGILPFISGGAPLIGYIAPKVQVHSADAMQAAVGGLAFMSTESSESVGIVYGVTSFGRTSDASVSLGIGYGYAGSDFTRTPVLMAGFEKRTSRRVKLVSENWVLPGEGAIVSLGPRFMGERMSADLGLAMPLFERTWFVFPLVNFVWNW